MKRAILLAVVLCTMSLTGCIGPDGGLDTQSISESCQRGERTKTTGGTVSPDESLTVEATIDGNDASGEIYVAGDGAGEFEAVFTHEGEEVDRINYQGLGTNIRPSRDQSGLPAGNYTLEVTSDAGTWQLEAGIDLSWSEGC